MIKKKHGGKRKGAGTKKLPPGEKKEWFQIGIPVKEIAQYGGKRKIIRDFHMWFQIQLRKL